MGRRWSAVDSAGLDQRQQQDHVAERSLTGDYVSDPTNTSPGTDECSQRFSPRGHRPLQAEPADALHEQFRLA
jgi:hypothetical protein